MAHKRPTIDEQTAATIVENIFGRCQITEVKELISFEDRNFLVKTASNAVKTANGHGKAPNAFVLKILNSIDSQRPESILAEIEAMKFLKSKGFPCPEVFAVNNNECEYMALVDFAGMASKVKHDNSDVFLVRLIAFLSGTTVNHIERNPDLLYTIGKFVGSVSKHLKDFYHEGIKSRTSQFKWNILEFLEIDSYLKAFTDEEEAKLIIRQVHDVFITKVKPKLKYFRSGTVHNDINGENILVTPPPYAVSGLIDFGDMVTSIIISELSNSMVFFMEGDCGIEFSGYLLAGYQAVFPLPVQERELLYYFVSARLCQLVMYSKSILNQDPSQDNVQAVLWKYYGILVAVWRQTKDEVDRIWKEAAENIAS